MPGTAEPADDPAPTREREVISAFAEITREAITDTRLEDLLTLVGRQLCQLLGVTDALSTCATAAATAGGRVLPGRRQHHRGRPAPGIGLRR